MELVVASPNDANPVTSVEFFQPFAGQPSYTTLRDTTGESSLKW